MTKTRILLIVVLFLFVGGMAHAEEGQLSGVFDVTYMSKLMDKGGEFYRQQGGLLETIDLDLWGTGFGMAVGHREATASGYVNAERFDYGDKSKNKTHHREQRRSRASRKYLVDIHP
jgi:hypothetical protein